MKKNITKAFYVEADLDHHKHLNLWSRDKYGFNCDGLYLKRKQFIAFVKIGIKAFGISIDELVEDCQ